MAGTNAPARRSVVERLGHSEERFRLLVESVQDYALFMLDPAGCVASWNQGAQRMKGYSAEEIVGQHFSRFYLREDVDRGKPDLSLREAASSGRVEDEGWRVRKDGSRFWATVVITAIRDETGTLRGFGKVTHDLTDRVKATLRLKESEARLQAFMDHSPAVMFIKNPDGRYQYVNDQFCRAFGLAREAVLGRIDADLFSAAQAARFQANDMSVLTAGVALAFEEIAEYQNGRHIGIVCKFPIRDAGGRITALGGVVTDVTERARRTRDLAHLQPHTGPPADAMGEDRPGAAPADRDVDALALMISRDLRPPLRNIEMLASQVREGMAELGAMSTRLSRIARAAAGLTRLTNDLLVFSRSARMQRGVHRTADLNSIVADARRSLGAAQSARRIDWKVGQLPQVVGDPPLLRVVFDQMLSNAVKFTQQRDPAVIEVTAIAVDGGDVVIKIADNGAGFDRLHAHRLFGVFQRLHRGNQFDGSGLGLAIAKRIIESHEGRIWAESQPEAGASFFFTLKAAAPSSDPPKGS